MSKLPQLDASESGAVPLTDLQASLLKGFVGFESLESGAVPLTDLQTSLLKGFVGFDRLTEELMKQFNSSLFSWARCLRPEVFNRYVDELIDTKYVPVRETVSMRHRTQPIKNDLPASQSDSSDNRLAYIFGSARDDKRFSYLYSTEGIKLFYQTMYDWIENLPSAKFKGIIESSLKEYEQRLSRWWGPSRRDEIYGYYYKSSNQAKIIASVFLSGTSTSILNECLFQKVINAMQVDISKNGEKQQNPGNKLIMQYSFSEDYSVYLDALKTHATELLNKQGHDFPTGVAKLSL